jgi:hypothetical protein
MLPYAAGGYLRFSISNFRLIYNSILLAFPSICSHPPGAGQFRMACLSMVPLDPYLDEE